MELKKVDATEELTELHSDHGSRVVRKDLGPTDRDVQYDYGRVNATAVQPAAGNDGYPNKRGKTNQSSRGRRAPVRRYELDRFIRHEHE
jgi:hypothetical protein